MLNIFYAVLPVFILIAVGYAAVKSGYVSNDIGNALSGFAVKIAVPVLLFRAMSELDFSRAFSLGGAVSFYIGAVACFFIGIVLARQIFKRKPGEAVAVGFSSTFSNTVLLGIVIIERSFGQDVLNPAFGIIMFHAPCLYILGIVGMELARSDGDPLLQTLKKAAQSIMANALMIGILLGVAVNLLGIVFPEPIMSATDMLASAAIPVALVGMGAAMTRYKLKSSMSESILVAGLSLFLHPFLALILSHYVFGLDGDIVRAIVVLAAMPPGMNIYVFAVMYNRAINLAASAFLFCTAMGIITISFWLYVLTTAIGS